MVKTTSILRLATKQESKENLTGKPVAVGPRRSLSECQKDRDPNTEKGDGNTTRNGNIV